MQHSDKLYLSAKSILDHYLTPDQHIALGVSGGPDSMTLLSIVQKYYAENKFDPRHIHVIFCDHQTRDETKQERELVQNHAHDNTIKQYVYTNDAFDETSLRNWRHQSFVEYCKAHNITSLGTGHHLDDRIEGTLLNLARGARVAGILSIDEYTEHFLDASINIVRPLINQAKTAILEYCKGNTIPYALDTSNTDITTSQRNKIRQLLKAINNPRRYESFKHLYAHLANTHNKSTLESQEADDTISIITQDTYDIINIRSGQRTPELLYSLYQHYNNTLNPRSNTLTTLAKQLNKQSGNKILYEGLEIKAYTYASIVSTTQ